MDYSRKGDSHKEFSLEELEELKFTAETTSFEDMEPLNVEDYLNNGQGPVDIVFSTDNNNQAVAEASEKTGEGENVAARKEEVMVTHHSTEEQGMEAFDVADYLNDEQVSKLALFTVEKQHVEDTLILLAAAGASVEVMAEDIHSQNAQDSNAMMVEEPLVVAVANEATHEGPNTMDSSTKKEDHTPADDSKVKRDTSSTEAKASDETADKKTNDKDPIEAQNNMDKSTKGKEKVSIADYSDFKRGKSSGAAYDDNDTDKMALVPLPSDQAQNTPSTSGKAPMGESSKVRQISVVTRTTSHLPLHLRLSGWLIREHPRRDLKRKDKFYIHLQSDVQFRSLNEVDDFVHLGLHPKRQIKKSILDPQSSAVQGPKEGPPQKRSTRRSLVWEFCNRIFRSDGTIICDIRFPGAQPIIQDHIDSRASQEMGSSEDTMSEMSESSEEWEEEEEPVRYTEQEVEAFYAETFERLIYGRRNDNGPQPQPQPHPQPQQQMNDNAEAEADADAASSDSSSASSDSGNTSTTTSTSTGGKRARSEEEPEEGPSSKQPRA